MELVPIRNHNQGLEPLNPKVEEMGQAIYNFNMLRGFPLKDHEIEDWAKMILDIRPQDSAETVKEAVKKLISGEIHYDKYKGIGNLVYALKVMDGTDFTGQL